MILSSVLGCGQNLKEGRGAIYYHNNKCMHIIYLKGRKISAENIEMSHYFI